VDALRDLRGHRHDDRVPVPEAEAGEEGPLKLYTSRWSNRALEGADVVAVGISRGTPRLPVRYRYRRIRELEPDGWMLGLADDEKFERAYLRKLDRLGAERIEALLRTISEEEGGKDLALLCYERDPAECHRSMFSRWWRERTGEVVEELPGTGPTGPTAQPTLFDEGGEA
jgi:hypothetical protein